MEKGQESSGKKPLKYRLFSVLRWTGWVLLVQFLLINISASLYADKLTRYYDQIRENIPNSSGNIFSRSWRLFTGPRYGKPLSGQKPVFSYDSVSLQTKNGTHISAWIIKPDSVSKGTVILFHGIGGTRSILMDEANEFRFLGYTVMMVDFRGHGESEGKTTSIGYREAEEVWLAYELMLSRGEKNIFLYGSSMGAVAISRALSVYALRPAGVILEMPFFSLQTYLKAKAKLLGFPAQPFAFFTTFWVGAEKGFSGFRHKTTRYLKQAVSPLLIQCGTRDAFVSEEEIRKIEAAAASGKKKLVLYANAQHESLLRFDTAKWRAEIKSFLLLHSR